MSQNPFRVNGNGSDYQGGVSQEEIRAALAALQASPQAPVYRRPVASSTPSRSPSAIGWILLGIGLGVILTLATRNQADQTPQNQTQVPRSLPALPTSTPVLRALPVFSPPTTHYEIGSRQMLTLPDGTTLPTVFRGYLSDAGDLPLHGSQIGDMYGIGPNLWVLSTIANSTRVGWVDPPEAHDQSANQSRAAQVLRAQIVVPRAQPVGSARLRRAKLVVPHAQLVNLPS